MEQSNTKLTKKNSPLKVVSIVFYVLIAVLIVLNVVVMSMAYFSDERTNSETIITTGSVKLTANFISDAGTSFTSAINEDSSRIMDGYTKTKNVAITVSGTSACYIRFSVAFKVGTVDKTSLLTYTIDTTTGQKTINSKTYGSLPNSSNWILANGTNVYYYKVSLTASSNNYIPMTYNINGLGNADQDKECKIILTIDSIQSAGKDFSSATSSTIASLWSAS